MTSHWIELAAESLSIKQAIEVELATVGLSFKQVVEGC
jgi:hypothetical protein